MAVIKKVALTINPEFDPKRCRQSFNGVTTVLHCHHYMSLYSQLAEDCSLLDAKKLLAEVAEDSFYPIFVDYFDDEGIEAIADRISIAEQFFAFFGLGKMNVSYAGTDSGEIELIHSHVDEGWIKKWGKHDRPINFIGQGFINAMFAAIFDKPARSYNSVESASIVCGAPSSKFEVAAI